MWPTSEQTACTLAGGMPALRQIISNCGNKLVRGRLRLQSRLQTFCWAARLLGIIAKWFHGTSTSWPPGGAQGFPLLLPLPLPFPRAVCLTCMSEIITFELASPSRGLSIRKWPYFCNISVGESVLICGSPHLGRVSDIWGRAPGKEREFSQREVVGQAPWVPSAVWNASLPWTRTRALWSRFHCYSHISNKATKIQKK